MTGSNNQMTSTRESIPKLAIELSRLITTEPLRSPSVVHVEFAVILSGDHMALVSEAFDDFMRRREAVSGEYINGKVDALLGI